MCVLYGDFRVSVYRNNFDFLFMNKRQCIILLGLAALPMMASAQRLKVVKGEVDCGKVGYEMPVTAEFELRNKGGRKMKITKAIVSCGCTAVDYPKEEIGAGDRFTVRLTYDARQLGHFEKSVGLVSNGSSKPVYLKMRGVVMADYVDYTKNYPYEIGDLRVDTRDLEFDDVNKGDRPVQTIRMVNAGTKTMRPNLMHLPPYLSATVTPEVLGPGRTGTVDVVLNSSKLRDFGLHQTAVYLANNPGDKVSADNEMSVSTVLLPGFDTQRGRQSGVGPKMVLSAETVEMDFGRSSKKTGIITVTNAGQAVLSISSLQMFTRGMKVTLGKREIKPGGSTKLKITADRDELLKLRTKPRVLMITNDPSKPKVSVLVKVRK